MAFRRIDAKVGCLLLWIALYAYFQQVYQSRHIAIHTATDGNLGQQLVGIDTGDPEIATHDLHVVRPSVPHTPVSQLVDVCVESNNKRTVSLFQTQFLHVRGNGRFRYHLVSNAKTCNPKWPIVKFVFQKTLVEGSSTKSKGADLVVVQGDEYCKCPVHLCGDASVVDFRQYYSETYQDWAVKKSKMPSMYLPLGPRFEFGIVNREELIPASARENLFNLIVSPTSPSRKYLVEKLRDADFLAPLGGQKVLVHETPQWRADANSKGFIKPDEYKSIVLNSKFTLCPAGHNPEAFRIFEACEAGSIPILVLDEEYANHKCQDAFAHLQQAKAPFLFLNSWDDLPMVLKNLGTEYAIQRMQMDVLKWHSEYWKSVAEDFECVLSRNFNTRARLESGQEDTKVYGPETQERCESKLFSSQQESLAQSKTENEAPSEVAGVLGAKQRKMQVPLITGCGRSGTLSLKDYLISLGIPAVHETVKNDHVSVSWLYGAMDKRYPFETISGAKLRNYRQVKIQPNPVFSPVVHLVRHPLKVVSSTRRCFCGRGSREKAMGRISDSKSWMFVERHIPIPGDNPPFDDLIRSCAYWLYWNRLIQKVHGSQMRATVFQLENLDPMKLVDGLGLKGRNTSVIHSRIPRSPLHKSVQDPRFPMVTWNDIVVANRTMAKEMFELAQEYGYEEGKTLSDYLE